MSCTVVNVRKAELNKRGFDDFQDWSNLIDTVYIGRNMEFYVKGAKKSKWANPFSVKKYGREGCLKKYRKYVIKSGLYDDILELYDKELGCWCKPEACHGDVLKELLEEKLNLH